MPPAVQVSDDTLKQRVEQALRADSSLQDSQTPALDINVDTRAVIVTLFGIVPSQKAKAAAEADARQVSGVKHVVNDLQVVASAKQAAVKARDEGLERAVKHACETAAFEDISVEVKNGVVWAVKDDLRFATAMN